MNKNEKLLESFTAYCKANPELRFWQALRNWSGNNFIGVASNHNAKDYTDTFYSDNQNGN